MSNFLYDLLGLIGYSHPVHPVFVHLPAGLSIGAVCFSLMAAATGKPVYRTTAYQVVVLAFLATFLTIPIGIFDWQRFYGAAWLFEIRMKAALAALYFVLVLAAVVVGRKHKDSPVMLWLYVLGMLATMGLGFFGGQLVYHGFAPEAPEEHKAGKRVFESHCSGCHRRGENIIQPNLPLRNAPQLRNFNEFRDYIRDPRMPDGSVGAMPRFSVDAVSDEQAKQLYDYLYFAFLTQGREGR